MILLNWKKGCKSVELKSDSAILVIKVSQGEDNKDLRELLISDQRYNVRHVYRDVNKYIDWIPMKFGLDPTLHVFQHALNRGDNSTRT